MYAGRVGYGGGLPYSLGESQVYNLAEVSPSGYGPYLGESVVYNLAEVAPSGYGPYLGDIFDDISRMAQEAGIVSGEVAKVVRGEAKIATVPTDRATITVPIPGKPVAASIPLLPLAIGAGLLLFLAFRRR